MAEKVCPSHIEDTRAEERAEERGEKQDFVALKHQESHSKEIGVALSAWSLENIRVETDKT